MGLSIIHKCTWCHEAYRVGNDDNKMGGINRNREGAWKLLGRIDTYLVSTLDLCRHGING